MELNNITEDRLKHMLGVARKCYSLSKEKGYSEELSRCYYIMGLLHGVGYEFSEDKYHHPEEGAKMLESFIKGVGLLRFQDMVEAIRLHGEPYYESIPQSTLPWLQILNEADLTVNSKGICCTIEERIADIALRYGENSEQVKKAKAVVASLNKKE